MSSGAGELERLWRQGRRGEAIREALGGWQELLAGDGNLAWLERALRSLGNDPAALAIQVRAARRDGPGSSGIRSLYHSGDPWWAIELLRESGIDSREARALEIEARIDAGEEASSSVSAWLDAHGDAEAMDAAMRWWLAAGNLGAAEDLSSENGGLGVWRARFALWRQCPAASRAELAGLPPSPVSRCLAAVAAWQEGDASAAEAGLRALVGENDLPESVECEAWSWLATILRKSGRYDEAMRAADCANTASPRFTLAPRLERDLAFESRAALEEDARLSLLSRWLRRLRGHTSRTLGDVEYASQLAALGCPASDPVIAGLEKAIELLAGNRTAYPTKLVDGDLIPLRLPLDPRHHGATLQRVLRTRGVEAVRQLYRDFEPAVGAHPLSRIYQGEVELWFGEYATAEQIFRDILEEQRKTLWAWIGLGASRMFQGELREALDVWQEGVRVMHFEGPTLFVFRGECHRRLGMREQARSDLETAVRQKPQRISARVNLALLEGEEEALALSLRDCRELAPLLVDQLEGSPAERLEQVLLAMRGNRSSSPDLMMTHLWGHVWRRAQPAALEAG